MEVIKNDNFIEIPFSYRNLDRYIVRTAILRSLKENLALFGGKLLDAGCGKMPYKGYILNNSKVEEYVGLDIESARIYDQKIQPDFTWNGVTMPFEDGAFDCAIATEVLEHCPEPEVFLREVHRVLKTDGVLFLTVPFIWNLHEVPFDQYRFTPFSLERHLSNSGFGSIVLKPMGGWHAAMAQMMGLWVRRSGLPSRVKGILSILFKPLMRFLIRMDHRKKVLFEERSMITGLYGSARKK